MSIFLVYYTDNNLINLIQVYFQLQIMKKAFIKALYQFWPIGLLFLAHFVLTHHIIHSAEFKLFSLILLLQYLNVNVLFLSHSW